MRPLTMDVPWLYDDGSIASDVRLLGDVHAGNDVRHVRLVLPNGHEMDVPEDYAAQAEEDLVEAANEMWGRE